MAAKRFFVCPDAIVEGESPPTCYSIVAMLNGEPGAPFRVLKGVVQRTAFIAPGLWVSGIRNPKQLLKTSFITSASISLFLTGFFLLERAKVIKVDRSSTPPSLQDFSG